MAEVIEHEGASYIRRGGEITRAVDRRDWALLQLYSHVAMNFGHKDAEIRRLIDEFERVNEEATDIFGRYFPIEDFDASEALR